MSKLSDVSLFIFGILSQQYAKGFELELPFHLQPGILNGYLGFGYLVFLGSSVTSFCKSKSCISRFLHLDFHGFVQAKIASKSLLSSRITALAAISMRSLNSRHPDRAIDKTIRLTPSSSSQKSVN